MAPPTSSASNEAQQRQPYRSTLGLQGKHITKNIYHDKEYLSVVAATQLVLCVVQILFLSTLPRLTIIVTLCWPSTKFYSKVAKISTKLRMYSFSIIKVYYLKSFIMAKHRQLLMGRNRPIYSVVPKNVMLMWMWYVQLLSISICQERMKKHL